MSASREVQQVFHISVVFALQGCRGHATLLFLTKTDNSEIPRISRMYYIRYSLI